MTSYAVRAIFAGAAMAAAIVGIACGLDVSGEAPVENPHDSGKATPDARGKEASGGGPDGADVVAIEGSPQGDGGSDGEATDAPVVAPPDFAWYKLDETSGNVAHDSTTNHYDVTLANVTWAMGANFAFPDAGGSGGSTDVAAGLRQAPVSFTAWLTPAPRSDETSNTWAIQPFPPNAVSGDVAGQFGFGIGLNVWTDGTAGSALSVENVAYNFSNGGGQFAAGTEYFVVAAIDAMNATVYVGGQLVATHGVSATGPASTTALRLGYHNEDTNYGTKRFYIGRMRDVRVYKRVLTAGEVAALFAAGPAP